MKRPSMSIGGRTIDADELRAAVSTASRAWLGSHRQAKAKAANRRHRALTLEAKEAKAQATAQAKRKRAAEREARELERLMARIGHLSRRSAREAEAMLRVRVSWKPGAEPKVTAVCPRSLYSQVHPEISARTAKAMTRSRVAADGFKNVVLRRTSRGYGRKEAGTREYRAGEAADLARYILREDGIEQGIGAYFSNILDMDGEHAVRETETSSVGDRRCAQIVGFWNALEAFEAEADADANVFSHIILAMPHELSPAGRSRALEDFCLRLDALHLPFVAALHRPDPKGDIRNFHAHIMMAPRPFAIEGPFAWSFEAGKATEFNLPCGIGWLRKQAADAFNRVLAQENQALRYSGVSQARRGVAATGDTHDGPAVTARKRKAAEDEAERDRLVRGLAARVVRAADLHTVLGNLIDAEASMKQVVPPGRAERLPPALAALRERFPDPLRLRGLSALDFMDFTAADRAADRWYQPALDLMVDLQRYPDRLVRDRDGKPEIVKEELKPQYLALLDEPPLPDIVHDMLTAIHRNIVAERERQKRIAREKEHVREQRLAMLRERPVILFDGSRHLLPAYRELFPPHVIELEGIREAMLACHTAALQAQKRRNAQETEGARKRLQPDQSTAKKPTEQETRPQNTAQQDKEDDDWERLLHGVYAGKGPTPGRGGR